MLDQWELDWLARSAKAGERRTRIDLGRMRQKPGQSAERFAEVCTRVASRAERLGQLHAKLVEMGADPNYEPGRAPEVTT